MSLSNLTIPSDLKCSSRIFRIAVMKMMSEISGEDYQFLTFSDNGFNRALRLFTKGTASLTLAFSRTWKDLEGREGSLWPL